MDANVTIQTRALVAPTLEHVAWIESLMLENAPPVTLRRRAFTPLTSERGWPIVFAHYELLDDDTVVEERAGAFYRIVHNRAEVVVRLRGGVRWEQRQAELLPFLLAGDVEWPRYEDDLVYSLLGFNL